MSEESIEVSGSEANSSIEVAQNGKGQYSYKVKIYFNNREESSLDIVDRAKKTYDKLHDTFGAPK